jgi:HSP20 family protein
MASLARYYDPVRDVSSLHTEVERMLRHAFGDREAATPAGAFTPALDVEETEEGFTLHVELPGVDAEQVDVSLEENVLTIAGERRFYDDKEAEGFRRITYFLDRPDVMARYRTRIEAEIRIRTVRFDTATQIRHGVLEAHHGFGGPGHRCIARELERVIKNVELIGVHPGERSVHIGSVIRMADLQREFRVAGSESFGLCNELVQFDDDLWIGHAPERNQKYVIDEGHADVLAG